MKYYVITGRVPGDHDDTVLDVGQHANGLHAFEAFRELMHDATDDEAREDIRKEHGTDIFVNAIISSDTPMEITT